MWRNEIEILIERFPLAFVSQVKLFWKEVREDMIPSTVERTIWDELPTANVDTAKLEHLFESRAKDMLTKVCSRFSSGVLISNASRKAFIWIRFV